MSVMLDGRKDVRVFAMAVMLVAVSCRRVAIGCHVVVTNLVKQI